MAATIFTIANQKGGVGKTTTALNIAAVLAAKKIPTLVIDMDPQGNATSGIGLEKSVGASLYSVLSGEGRALDKVQATRIPYFSMIPSEVDLAALEIELSQRDEYLTQLRSALREIREGDAFKAVIIDCPPALGLTSMNALAAADHLLITMQCEYLAMEGLGQILKVVAQLQQAGVNPDLDVGGIIMTMFDVRTNLSRQVLDEVRRVFGDKVFKSVIPRSIRLAEAPSFGQTIFEYDPLSPGSVAYTNLAKEVAKRFQLK